MRIKHCCALYTDLENDRATTSNYKPFNPKYSEWYGPSLDLEHTIQVCRGEGDIYCFKVTNTIADIYLLRKKCIDKFIQK